MVRVAEGCHREPLLGATAAGCCGPASAHDNAIRRAVEPQTRVPAATRHATTRRRYSNTISPKIVRSSSDWLVGDEDQIAQSTSPRGSAWDRPKLPRHDAPATGGSVPSVAKGIVTRPSQRRFGPSMRVTLVHAPFQSRSSWPRRPVSRPP